MIKIAPSILSADFSQLGNDVRDVCSKGADYIHVDVMDGHFVPNISFGAGVMKSLNSSSTVPYDVHLMIENPDRYLEDFATDMTEFITVHQEACVHLHRTVKHIQSLKNANGNIKAGISLNPSTPVAVLENVFGIADLILIMSVNPGFGGQQFISESLNKIKKLRDIRDENGYSYEIEVDGGINPSNAEMIISAGADIIVAGSAIFKAEDRKHAMDAVSGRDI